MHRITPVLFVSHMARSLEFYTKILGFTVVSQETDSDGAENCMLACGAVSLMLSTGTHMGDSPQFTGTLYFEMDGVSAFYDRIKGNVRLAWPLERMDYGQTEFGIRDPDGYTLAFAQRDRT